MISLGKTIAVTEADLFDEGGALVAHGTFTNRVTDAAVATGPEQNRVG